jgi:hypothetical protein
MAETIFTLHSEPVPYVEMLKHLERGECFASGNEVFRLIETNSDAATNIVAHYLIDNHFKKALAAMPDRQEYVENNLVLAISQPCFVNQAKKDDDGLVGLTGKQLLVCLVVGRYMDETIFEKTGTLCFGLEMEPESRRFIKARKQLALSAVH